MNLLVDANGAVELKSFIKNRHELQIIDVRSNAEWQEGHLEDAIHMSLDRIDEGIEEIDPQKPVVFICAKGVRAAIAWKYFKQQYPDSLLSGYLVATIDYINPNAPVFHELDKKWHKDIADYIKDI